MWIWNSTADAAPGKTMISAGRLVTTRPASAAPLLAVLAVAIILLLIGLYSLAYFSLVESPSAYGRTWSNTTDYRAGDWAETFFAPMHWLDRNWIRPGYWNSGSH